MLKSIVLRLDFFISLVCLLESVWWLTSEN